MGGCVTRAKKDLSPFLASFFQAKSWKRIEKFAEFMRFRVKESGQSQRGVDEEGEGRRERERGINFVEPFCRPREGFVTGRGGGEDTFPAISQCPVSVSLWWGDALLGVSRIGGRPNLCQIVPLVYFSYLLHHFSRWKKMQYQKLDGDSTKLNHPSTFRMIKVTQRSSELFFIR